MVTVLTNRVGDAILLCVIGLLCRDGNCFLSAVVKYLSENENDIEVAALRRKLVEHMRSEKIHYKNVVAFDKEMTEEEQDIKFEHLLQDLSVDGHWNMELAAV
jgi:hypothetical protein